MKPQSKPSPHLQHGDTRPDLPAPTRGKPGHVHRWEVLAAHHTVPGQQRDPARRKKPCPLPLAHMRTMVVNFPPVWHLTKDKCKVKNQAEDPLALLQAFSGPITGSWPSGHTPPSARATRPVGFPLQSSRSGNTASNPQLSYSSPATMLLPAAGEGTGLWAVPERRGLQVLEELQGP